ncbi:hypothetical protein THAOC_18184, partial [Thalassiosira oceanica]
SPGSCHFIPEKPVLGARGWSAENAVAPLVLANLTAVGIRPSPPPLERLTVCAHKLATFTNLAVLLALPLVDRPVPVPRGDEIKIKRQTRDLTGQLRLGLGSARLDPPSPVVSVPAAHQMLETALGMTPVPVALDSGTLWP